MAERQRSPPPGRGLSDLWWRIKLASGYVLIDDAALARFVALVVLYFM
jgi:hypothetical protein